MYEPSPHDNAESDQTILVGEDPVDRFESHDKPVRIMHKYVFFDPLNNCEMIPLDFLDDASESRRGFEAAGFVAPLFVDDDDSDIGSNEEDIEDLPRLHTSAIWRYSIDYATHDEWVSLR